MSDDQTRSGADEPHAEEPSAPDQPAAGRPDEQTGQWTPSQPTGQGNAPADQPTSDWTPDQPTGGWTAPADPPTSRWAPADQPTSQWTSPAGPPASPLPPIGNAPTGYSFAPQPVERPRGRNWLLPIVGLVAIVLVAAVAIFVFLNQTQSVGADAARPGYAYLPADSAMAMEMRLDLPAGQREEFVRFVTRFPQVGDSGQVERRMDELLNEAIASSSGGLANYQDDVKPWFTGWIVLGGTMPRDAMAGDAGYFVIVFGSTDRASAEIALERLRGSGNWTSQPGPGGATLWSGPTNWDGSSNTYAVPDDAVVAGNDFEAVRAALQRKASEGPSLLGRESFTAALDRQPGGRMAMYWMDYEALLAAIDEASQGPFGNPFQFTCPGAAEPRSITGSLSMRDGNAHFDLMIESAPGGPTFEMRDTGLAQRMPADTFFFTTVHDVGDTVSTTLDCLRSNPMISSQLRDIEDQIGQPIDGYLSWAGDAAVGVRYDGTRVTGGLVVKVTDQSKASETMGQLRGLITAAGASGETDVRVIDGEYNGARMVTFEMDDPFGSMQPPMPEPSFAYAFAGDLLVLGFDASFARAVIDTQADNSLATNAEYRRAVEAAGGTNNTGVMYLDFATTWQLAEGLMLPMGGIGFNPQLQEARAIIGSLESLAMVSRADGDTFIVHLVLTTREP
jgi:hypothetical protein